MVQRNGRGGQKLVQNCGKKRKLAKHCGKKGELGMRYGKEAHSEGTYFMNNNNKCLMRDNSGCLTTTP